MSEQDTHTFPSSPHGVRYKLIDHLGVACPDIEAALPMWADVHGLECKHVEEVKEQKVKTAFLPVGESRIELLEPTEPDSPVGKFLEKRGPGIHHVAYRVDDIEAELARLKAQGVRLIDESPRVGAGGALIAFIHPKETGGVLTELCQRDE